MKVSITNLSVYSEHIGKPAKKEQPIFTAQEFGLLCTAVRYYLKHGMTYDENATPKQKRRRILSRDSLNKALCKLRTLTPQEQ